MDDRSARPPPRRRWPWVVAVVVVTTYAISVPSSPFGASALLLGFAIVPLAAVGALLAQRLPDNRIGKLLLLTAAELGAVALLASVGWAERFSLPAMRPAIDLTGVGSAILFDEAAVTALVIVPLVFPNGRLPSSRWRWVIAAVVIGLVADALKQLLLHGSPAVGLAPNPLHIAAPAGLRTGAQTIASIAGLLVFVAAAYGVWVRFRRGTSVERQQLKWLVAVAAIAAIIQPAAFLLAPNGPTDIVSAVLSTLRMLSIAALPMVIGAAVLRYHLYDIDRIVSRTIGWAIVTGALAVSFAISVLALQTVVEPLTGRSTIVIAGSTLVVASLFDPLRTAVQRTVDRRFHRTKVDGERLAGVFAERLRDQVDPDAIEAEITATVRAALDPAAAALWRRGSHDDSPSQTATPSTPAPRPVEMRTLHHQQ